MNLNNPTSWPFNFDDSFAKTSHFCCSFVTVVPNRLVSRTQPYCPFNVLAETHICVVLSQLSFKTMSLNSPTSFLMTVSSKPLVCVVLSQLSCKIDKERRREKERKREKERRREKERKRKKERRRDDSFAKNLTFLLCFRNCRSKSMSLNNPTSLIIQF